MFAKSAPRGRLSAALNILALIYHSTVRSIRQGNRNAIFALLSAMLQTMILVGAFYFMFTILGLRKNAIRGDFLLYIMSGIFLFVCHIKAMGAVFGAEGPVSPMMQHAPMNTIIAIASAALGSLYIQVISMFCVLFLYHIIISPIQIDDPAGAFAMLLLAWFTGVAAGLVFLGLKPWIPGLAGILQSVYSRANMIASGKMFVANTLPGYLLAMFDWNPLFHAIDQARGFTFINYNPHFSNIQYPIKVAIVLIMIGLMLEFFARKNVSLSRSAGR